MSMKLLGALLVILGCGGFGFSLAATHRREEQSLRQLAGIVDFISSELQYQLTPLPQLFLKAAAESRGCLRSVLTVFTDELDQQISPDVSNCMYCAIAKHKDIPLQTKETLKELGRSLGKFDLQGQLKSLDAVRSSCQKRIEELECNKGERLRSYQTLGLCAGAALAVLLI